MEKNQSSVPNNSFVKSVVSAYDYNVGNGGGRNMVKIVTNEQYKVGVKESDVGSKSVPMQNGILFNPEGGLQLEDRYVLSPATILEHEFGHVVARKEGTNDLTPDEKFGNATEKKIIQGEELVTAKANGELPKSHKGRARHGSGLRIITQSSTSTEEVSEQKSQEYRDRVRKEAERRGWNWTSE